MNRKALLITIFFAGSAVSATADDTLRPEHSVSPGEMKFVECLKWPAPYCERICTPWANSQPDFQFSLNACVSQCLDSKHCYPEVTVSQPK
jgi:hypothetical protein